LYKNKHKTQNTKQSIHSSSFSLSICCLSLKTYRLQCKNGSNATIFTLRIRSLRNEITHPTTGKVDSRRITPDTLQLLEPGLFITDGGHLYVVAPPTNSRPTQHTTPHHTPHHTTLKSNYCSSFSSYKY
jgi:hypothetical protein